MTAPGGGAPTPAPPDDDPRASAKAAVIIGLAVLIGLVFLWKGLAQEGGVVETSSESSAPVEKTTTTYSPPTSEATTTTAAARPAGEVQVMVANGSGKSGVAGTASTKLKSAGFTKVDTTNASVTPKSAVYYASGAQADAEAVAKALGMDASAVAALPSPPPADPKGATVLVVVGSDKA